MVLVNAVYFKGIWESGFNPRNTRKRKFNYGTCNASSMQQIEMMSVQSKFNYANITSLMARVIEMPYKYSDIKMTIILPWTCDGLESVEQALKQTDLSSLEKHMNNGRLKVDVTISKFTVKFSQKLKAPLTSVRPIIGVHLFCQIHDRIFNFRWEGRYLYVTGKFY